MVDSETSDIPSDDCFAASSQFSGDVQYYTISRSLQATTNLLPSFRMARADSPRLTARRCFDIIPQKRKKEHSGVVAGILRGVAYGR